MKNLKTFTLAEVLITLVTIGVVAAMTIPVFLVKVESKIKENQTKVIEERLVQGLNLFNTLENGLSGKTYPNTEKFIEGLSRHYKLSSICGADELNKCWPYENLKRTASDGTIEEFPVAELKTALRLGLSGDYLAPAAFLTNAGTPFIISYKNDCTEDTDKPMTTISSCVKLLYDYNGKNGPNELNGDKDIINYGISLNKPVVIAATIKNTGGYIGQCPDKTHLPSRSELILIAREIYKGNPNVSSRGTEYLEINTESDLYKKLSAAFNNLHYVSIWGSDYYNGRLNCTFGLNKFSCGYVRPNVNRNMICVSD